MAKEKTIIKKGQNKLYYGDNIDILRRDVKDESVDLCYIDPPFNSKRNYNQIYNNIGTEDKAKAQAFLDTWTWDMIAEEGYREIITNYNRSFTKQSILLIEGFEKILGKGSLLAYLVSMTLRIAEIYRVLKPSGSFFLHCDPTASHYLKILIDSIFCANRKGELRNEIIWHYEKWTSPSRYQLQRNHDIIFFYSKDSARINTIKEVTENLKEKYKKGYLFGGGGGSEGLVVYDPENPKVKSLIASGKYKVVYATQEGKPISDVWKIPFINPVAKERLGYPTQKPEALLEKIIKLSSNEGDTILDAYCGCGTTVAVAERLKRNWIGIDITYQSISLILKRLEDSFTKKVLENIELNGVPQDFASAIALANKKDDRTRKEFEKWAVLTYTNNRAIINEKKGGDGGIDGTVFMLDRTKDGNTEELKQVLFSVKSNKALTPSVIRDLNGTIERENAGMGVLITLYKMENLEKESKKYGNYTNNMTGQAYSKIEVVCVEDILRGKAMNLPIALQVIKKAQAKENLNQNELFE